MSTPPRDTTLLVLLLSLRKIETLSESDKNLLFPRLFEVGEQLELDPDDWDFIFEGLIDIVNKQSVFKQIFQTIETQIKTLDDQTLENLLPTKDELSQAFKLPIEIEIRGDDHSQPKFNKPAPLQITVKVLKSVNPCIAAKQSDWLNRITKILPPLEP
jgi:hypothetical protein